ncbi:Uncharacterised protein [Escherichia coli]|uniref:Uncharacterized protein n=1 Tax=Escherichia coli TaxID=562 RepID=A0A2X1LD10_ECOLX|nr:Uncharacterised protein [Escherichia coli]
MGNVSIPQSLTDALTALKLDALKTAMNAINAKIEAAGSAGGDSNGGQGGAGGAQAPVITQDEIEALREGSDSRRSFYSPKLTQQVRVS